MGVTTFPRRMAKLEYLAVRLPFTLLEEHVVARYWDDEAALRRGFERFLGSLDQFAGWFLADDALCRQGDALTRRGGLLAKAGQLETRAQARRAQAEQKLHAGQAQARQAGAQAHEQIGDKIAAAYQQEQEGTQQVCREAGARASAGKALAGQALETRAAKERDLSGKPAAKACTVDVTFTLPAEVQAGSVALCGEFNEWSADSIRLERAGDGSWRAIVALEPGRSYRYRYLLDGERWENAWQADGYVPNSYGSDDSVVCVE